MIPLNIFLETNKSNSPQYMPTEAVASHMCLSTVYVSAHCPAILAHKERKACMGEKFSPYPRRWRTHQVGMLHMASLGEAWQFTPFKRCLASVGGARSENYTSTALH